MEKRITTPLTKDKIKELKAGDSVLLTGTIYTARDAAHERMALVNQTHKQISPHKS